MTSGRDKMMSNWKTDQEADKEWKQKMIIRMTDYRQTLITELQRLDTEIVKLEMELENDER